MITAAWLQLFTKADDGLLFVVFLILAGCAVALALWVRRTAAAVRREDEELAHLTWLRRQTHETRLREARTSDGRDPGMEGVLRFYNSLHADQPGAGTKPRNDR